MAAYSSGGKKKYSKLVRKGVWLAQREGEQAVLHSRQFSTQRKSEGSMRPLVRHMHTLRAPSLQQLFGLIVPRAG